MDKSPRDRYFDSPAEREGVESMFHYYHDHFAQEPEDFLHPLFGRSQSVKIQMASAVKLGILIREHRSRYQVQDIGSLVSSIAVETDQFMTEIRDRVAMMSQKSERLLIILGVYCGQALIWFERSLRRNWRRRD